MIKQTYMQQQSAYYPSYYYPAGAPTTGYQHPNYNTIPIRMNQQSHDYLRGASSPSLENSQILKNQSNLWNVNEDNGVNVSNFPFGRERTQIFHQVQKKMEMSIDEENKRILEKFRINAIKNRNQRVMKHLGKIPYITESMGSGLDASKLVDNEPVRKPLPLPQPIPMPKPGYAPVLPRPQYIYVPITHQQQKQPTYPIVKTPRKIKQESSSIGVQVDFQRQFPLRDKKKKKKRYYTIEQQEQEQAMTKIEDMLHDINAKLKKNTELLSKSMASQSPIPNQSRFVPQRQPSFDYSPTNFFSSIPETQSRLPSIKYSSKELPPKTRSKTLGSESLKQHLKLIKKNRRRLQDLDEYIYR